MKSKPIFTVVKVIGGVVISVGIGALAANLIKATTPEDVKKLTKFCIGVGSFFVAGIAARTAHDQFGKTIDEVSETIDKFTGAYYEKPEEVIIETTATDAVEEDA